MAQKKVSLHSTGAGSTLDHLRKGAAFPYGATPRDALASFSSELGRKALIFYSALYDPGWP